MTAPDLAARFASALGRLARPDDAVVAAVSGGADSVAAARLLAQAGRPFVVAHFDHGLRPESALDAAFVADLAAGLGAPYRGGGADVGAVAAAKGWNVEDAARRLRYAFLHRVLREAGGGVIVVAHTADDQAETLLLQLLRGAAYPGGMAARRGAVVRPLLGERRAALRDYLRHLAQTWREDPTNLDQRASRAWLRHGVLPALEERFPGATERLARTAGELRGAREALEGAGRERFGGGDVPAQALAAAPAAVRRAAIAARIREQGAAPSAAMVDEVEAAVLRAAAGPRGPWQRDLGRGVRAGVAYGNLTVGRPAATVPHAGATPVTDASQLPAGVDECVLSRPGLVLRGRLPGDRIRLPGGTKLVSDLLIDRKVPRAERGALRLLADGSEVLWLEGIATALGAGRQDDGRAPQTADVRFMRQALAEARRGLAAGEVPVGAVVVVAGEVVAAAHNLTEARRDPTAHAEVLALRAAAAARGDWRLADATLYVTLEPCPMCLGAAMQAQLGRLVYGAPNLREGALGSVTNLAAAPWKRVPEVTGGVEAEAAAALLRVAFAARRAGTGGAPGEAADAPGAEDAHRDGTS